MMFDSWLHRVSSVRTHMAVISLPALHRAVGMWLLILLPERPVGDPRQSTLWGTLRRKKDRRESPLPGMVLFELQSGPVYL